MLVLTVFYVIGLKYVFDNMAPLLGNALRIDHRAIESYSPRIKLVWPIICLNYLLNVRVGICGRQQVLSGRGLGQDRLLREGF